MIVSLSEYFEIDPAVKTEEWANKVVTHLRFYQQQVIATDRAAKNISILLGDYDTTFVRDMFDRPEDAQVDFTPKSLLEKIRNVIISEMEAMGEDVELVANDPTAINQRKKDKALLKNRAAIEAYMSHLQQSINMPQFSLANEKGEDGRGLFNGNVEQFDQMSLDPNSDEDLDYFFNTYYRLDHEIMAENVYNFFKGFNNTKEAIGLYVDDIMAKKSLFRQIYMDQISGAIKYKYLAPETVSAIMGKNRDFSDALSIGYVTRMTVAEFFRVIGNEFNYETDFDILINAVNFSNRQSYTGVYADGNVIAGFYREGHMCDYSNFLQFKVDIGYVEWKTVDGTKYRTTNSNFHGNFAFVPESFKKAEKYNKYQRVTYYNEVTLKSFYLITSASSQKLYKYGKLNFQATEGAEDEYSNFSIVGYKEVGKTITEIAENCIRIVCKAFAKMEYELNQAKPQGRGYNASVLRQIANKMIQGNGSEITKVTDVIKLFKQYNIELWEHPESESGQQLGGGGVPNYEIKNGLPESIKGYWEAIQWAESYLISKIGFSPARSVAAFQPRDVDKLQDQSNQYSEKATGYIPRMLSRINEHTAKRTLLMVQDVIAFKDKATLPYKFLLRALGDETMDSLEGLDNVAAHRYGIIANGYDAYSDRQLQKQMEIQQLQQGKITYAQWLLISQIRSPKRAAQVLAYEMKKAEKAQQAAQQQQQQAQMQLEQMQHKNRMDEIQLKGTLDIQREEKIGQWLYLSRQDASNTELTKAQLKIQAEENKIDQKNDAVMEQKSLENNNNMPALNAPAA
jgi:hypothetical protein